MEYLQKLPVLWGLAPALLLTLMVALSVWFGQKEGRTVRGTALIAFCWLASLALPFIFIANLTQLNSMLGLPAVFQQLVNNNPMVVVGGCLLLGAFLFELFFFLVLFLAKARLWVFLLHVCAMCALGAGCLGSFRYWPSIYDRYFAPAYENYDARAAEALCYCRANNLRTDFCIFVDFGLPSSQKRFMVYDLQNNQVVFAGLVAHGMGAPSTVDQAAFSNLPGSKCSSLGKYHVGMRCDNSKVGRHYKMQGMNMFTNGNAAWRGIYIHTSRTVNACEAVAPYQKIPLGRVSEGCFTVSSNTFNYLEENLHPAKPRMLLWAFCGQNG